MISLERKIAFGVSNTKSNNVISTQSFSLVVFLFLVLNLIMSSAFAKNAKQKQFRQGHIIVKVKAGVSAKSLEKLAKRFLSKKQRSIVSDHTFIIETSKGNEKRLIQRLNAHPDIAYAELDLELELNSVETNDALVNSQWYLPKINMSDAWSSSTGKDMVVAVLDTGITVSHEDMAGQILTGRNVVSDNSDVTDINGHGTQTSGVIAALTNNSIGISSIAHNAKILPIKISEKSNGYAYSSHVAEGLNWAADNGADIANLSYDFATSTTVSNAASYFRSKGGLVVISAGNSGGDLNCTENSNVIIVSATDSSDNKASWSDYGNCVDVSAPGVSIKTTFKSGGYGNISGTSFSAPITAAVLAVLKSANPQATINELETALKNSADKSMFDGDFSNKFGYGRIDANAALASLGGGEIEVDQIAPTVEIITPNEESSHSENVEVDVNATDDVEVSRVELYIDNELLATEQHAPYEFVIEQEKYNGQSLTIHAVAYDTSGNISSSDTVQINIEDAIDSDDDGVIDSEDAFPEDATETHDSDLDGVGDNADAFPEDATETHDSDLDGVGDNADAFPEDATETHDSDLDGVGDNADAFPEDATETQDSDLDGVGDNADAFPADAR
uniref:S8 family serine peptidase n=1 Tax=Thalassotalea crassostreae TaxID=1763536 RepID=UPI000838F423